MEQKTALVNALVEAGSRVIRLEKELIRLHKLRNHELERKNYELLREAIDEFDTTALVAMMVVGDDYYVILEQLPKEDMDMFDKIITISSLIKFAHGEMDEDAFNHLMRNKFDDIDDDLVIIIKKMIE